MSKLPEPIGDIHISYRSAYAFAKVRLGDRLIGGVSAEDIAQESVISLLTSSLPLRYSKNRAYFLTRNAYKTQSRSTSRFDKLVKSKKPKDNLMVSNIQMEEFFNSTEYSDIFKTIVGYLLNGYSYKEIAHRLNMSVSLVHYHAKKHKDKLKDHI